MASPERFPDLTLQPVRQLAAAEGRLLERIRGLLFATVALILALTALGVLAAMAGLALERRRDVGLMKALGGTVRRVMRFFLAEAAAIGIIGGIVGCGAGMLLGGLGRRARFCHGDLAPFDCPADDDRLDDRRGFSRSAAVAAAGARSPG